MNNYKKILLCLLFVFLGLPIATNVFAFALNITYPTISIFGNSIALPPGSSTSQFAAYLFNIGMTIGVLLAVTVIAIGGVYYLASFGSGKFTGQGKEWIMGGIKGLLLLLCAYLIAYTINPDLLIFKMGNLINTFIPGGAINFPGQQNRTNYVYYNEIPIGTLTETLLSKTTYCYDFDVAGNPIPTPLKTDDKKQVSGPTYSNHDRVDCLLKLMDAAQKKANVISELAQQEKSLMDTCSCAGKCNDPCNKGGKGCSNPPAGSGDKACNNNTCAGKNGEGSACEQKKGTDSCCDPKVKNKIEKGPIEVGCGANNTTFNYDQKFNYETAGLSTNFFLAQLSSNKISNTDIINQGSCTPGEVMVCSKNGSTGEQTCSSGGKWSDCDTSGDITNHGSCTPGDSNVCSKNGSTGIQTCSSGGKWSDCDTSNDIINKGNCTPGDSNVCSKNGAVGVQTCDLINNDGFISGKWSDCDTSNDIINKGSCTPGDSNVCSKNSSPGIQTCSFDGKWGACDTSGDIVNHGSCTPSDSNVCSKNGAIGTQTCSSNGIWGACDTSGNNDINKGNCTIGQIAMCDKNNSIGEQSCLNNGKSGANSGIWGVCAPLIQNNGQCNSCDIPKKTYKGLEEFRSNLSDVLGAVEGNVQVDKKNVGVINIDGNEGVQTSQQWNNLKLVDQLTYLKQKIQQMESDIKGDEKNLNDARSAVANCYDVKSSVDFIKIKEEVNPNDNIIISSTPWSSSEGAVDSSKYCKGFNYSNSSCYNLCNKMCPDETTDVAKCYDKCSQADCDPDDQQCLSDEQDCVEDCFNKRPCNNMDSSNNGGKNPANFGLCLSTCQQNCSSNCSKTYLTCSDDYKFCASQCINNSKCIKNNEDACLVNYESINTNDFEQCLKQNDEGNIKNCIDSAYLCKYGSDEYAGYPDCTNGETGCAPNAQEIQNKDYSSPWIFDNQKEQICADPYSTCQKGNNAGESCLNLYPAATKCPSNSFCPQCPCGEINQNVDFNVTNPNDPNTDKCNPQYNNIPNQNSVSTLVSARDLVTGECNDYEYNTDPLTFYCKTIFAETKPLTGQNFKCSSEDDIPVGQAVDDSRAWADNLQEIINNYLDGLKNVFKDIQKISNKQPTQYCRCDSKFDADCSGPAGKPICTTKCQYVPPSTATEGGANGQSTLTVTTPASCSVMPCSGDSCQQMIDYMTEFSDDYMQMRTDFVKLLTKSLQDGRTDPLKELVYSRNAMNSCSKSMVQKGENNVKTLSCTIAYPSTGFLDTRCYGILNGIVNQVGETYDNYNSPYIDKLNEIKPPPADATDNWFCCQKISK